MKPRNDNPSFESFDSSLPSYYEAAWQQALDAMRLIDASGIILNVNDAFCSLVGMDREKLIGASFEVIYAEHHRAAMKEKLLDRIALHRIESHFSRELRLWDNRKVYLETTNTIIKGSDGNDRLLSVFHDKTEQRISEEKYAQLLQNAGQAIYIVQNETVVFANSECEQISGYSVAELLGKHIGALVPPNGIAGVLDHHRALLEGNQTESFADFMQIVCKSGARRWIEVRGVRVEWNGNPATLNFASDRTESHHVRRLLEARLQLAQFSESHTLDELLQKTLDIAEELTGSTIGFYHFLEDDQVTLSLQMWSTNTLAHMCKAEGKGQHYPVDIAGVWVDCIRTKKPVIHNDYASLLHKKGLPPGHAPILRELTLPVIRGGMIKAILGVGNKDFNYDESDVNTISALADLAWEIVDRKRTEDEKALTTLLLARSQEIAHVGSWQNDYGNRQVRWSDEVFRIMGLPVSSTPLTFDEFLNCIHPDDREHAHAAYKESLKSAMPLEVVHRIIRPDGTIRILLVKGEHHAGNDGRVLYSFGIMHDITDRHESELLLKQSEERYRLLVEHSPDAIALHQDGKFVYINPAGLRLIGASSAEELLGKSPLSIVDPEFQNVATQRTVSAEKDRAILPVIEERFVKLDGTKIDVEVAAIGSTYNGKPAVQVVARDISVRKSAIALLEQSEKRFRSLVGNLPGAVYRCEVASPWRIFYMSTEIASICGHETEEFTDGRITYADIVHPEDLNYVDTCVRNGVQSHRPYEMEYRVCHTNGSVRYVFERGRASYAADDTPEFLDGVIIDVSNRRQAELALRESEERYRNLADATFEGICIIKHGFILDANDQFAKMVCMTRPELVGRSVMDFVADDQKEKVEERIKSGHKEAYESVARRADGTDFPVEIRARQSVVGDATVRVTAIRDISERKRTEQLLIQTQKTESLGILAGGVAHDFNNLLQGIIGNASVGLKKFPVSHPAYVNIQRIEASATRAADLTQQLLAYSGHGHFFTAPILLNSLLQDMTERLHFAVPQNARIEFLFAQNLSYIQADSAQIAQAITNLVENAGEAIGKHPGVVQIRTYDQILEANEIAQWTIGNLTTNPGLHVVLEIGDNGSGITQPAIGSIFDPFFSTKFTGRGLGLPAVLGIVRGHHGIIQVQSAPGHGTTIRLAFPAVRPKEQIAEPEPPAMPQGKTILVIDDEELVGDLIQDIMQDIGITTLRAQSGREGLELFTAHRETIDLTILDLSMPGLSGSETFVRLCEIDPKVRVIVTSGYSEDEAMEQIPRKAILGFIQKPFRVEELIRRIRSYLAP